MAQQPTLEVVSHTGSPRSDLNFYVIFGEVQYEGTSGVPVSNIVVKATFYGATGELIETKSYPTFLSVLIPGRKTPFIIYGNINAESYDLEIASYEQYPDGKPQSLEILYGQVQEGRVFVGVENHGDENATAIRVVATFYDGAGDVAAAESFLGHPGYEMPPRWADVFDIPVPFPDKWSTYKTVSLTAESLQFAAEAEINGIPMSEDGDDDWGILVGAAIVISMAAVVIGAYLILRAKRKPRRKVRAKHKKPGANT
ncbi:MAG: hypothetical protein NWE81_02050 [Candidatus Bathyarchaeota archaeon]|nr:hypothetical protein [Candidatus Bathyarchaeota archaeon]